MTAADFNAALADLGLTVPQAARRWGIPYRTVRRWADDERRVPALVPHVLRLESGAVQPLQGAGVMDMAATQWQPIATAPRDGSLIDVHSGTGRTPDALWSDRKSCWIFWGPDAFDGIGPCRISPQPTHWMPLPPPPQE